MLQLDCSPSQQLALGLVAARHSDPPAPPSRRGDSTRSDSSRNQVQETGSAQGGHPQVTNSVALTGPSRNHTSPTSMLSPFYVSVVCFPCVTMVQQPVSLAKAMCVLYAGAWRSRYDEVAVSAWMALSGARNVKEQDWGLAVASIPMPDGEGWGLAFGRCAASCWSSCWTCIV